MQEKRQFVQVKLLKNILLISMEKTCITIPDTDSIHTGLSIEELKQFCEIDPVKLGAWKHEGDFEKAKFVRQKCYIELVDGNLEVTCAGMPKTCYKYVEWDKFKTGFSCPRKAYI